jgi:hypothetical protein
MASRRVDRRPATPEVGCSRALANVTSTATWNRTPRPSLAFILGAWNEPWPGHEAIRRAFAKTSSAGRLDLATLVLNKATVDLGLPRSLGVGRSRLLKRNEEQVHQPGPVFPGKGFAALGKLSHLVDHLEPLR